VSEATSEVISVAESQFSVEEATLKQIPVPAPGPLTRGQKRSAQQEEEEDDGEYEPGAKRQRESISARHVNTPRVLRPQPTQEQYSLTAPPSTYVPVNEPQAAHPGN
jgi:hypothetical protein